MPASRCVRSRAATGTGVHGPDKALHPPQGTSSELHHRPDRRACRVSALVLVERPSRGQEFRSTCRETANRNKKKARRHPTPKGSGAPVARQRIETPLTLLTSHIPARSGAPVARQRIETVTIHLLEYGASSGAPVARQRIETGEFVVETLCFAMFRSTCRETANRNKLSGTWRSSISFRSTCRETANRNGFWLGVGACATVVPEHLSRDSE